MICTTDLSKFGSREMKMATQLLNAYVETNPDWLWDGVTVMFNINSGYVFLTDEDFNVGIMKGDELVQFFSCPECGTKGTRDELMEDGNPCCWAYVVVASS